MLNVGLLQLGCSSMQACWLPGILLPVNGLLGAEECCQTTAGTGVALHPI